MTITVQWIGDFGVIITTCDWEDTDPIEFTRQQLIAWHDIDPLKHGFEPEIVEE